ncbi:MAG: hypothetical protein HYU69_01790 [Bacteroidetes bacterium]|nr:hypothetical protein [Bacteroidota bacterium]
MTRIALKKQLYKAIDNIEDTSFLKAVYNILNDKIRDRAYEFTDEQKAELDEQFALHKTGKTKSYTVKEVRAMALARKKK